MLVTGCPCCGEDQTARSWGLDCLVTPLGVILDWQPCCAEIRGLVALHGWHSAWGEALAETAEREVGVEHG